MAVRILAPAHGAENAAAIVVGSCVEVMRLTRAYNGGLTSLGGRLACVH